MSELLTIPAFVDLHVHLREPSDNKSETIAGGSRAALIGGIAMVCDMPNNPGSPTWSEDRVDQKRAIADKSAAIVVEFYSGSQPESDNIGELKAMSQKTIGLKLYGAPTTGNDKDYEAREFEPIVQHWHKVAPDKPIMFHAGWSNLEDMIDLVSKKYKHPLHICHIHIPEEVSTVNEAKEAGQPVTCGVTPHHLFKTSHDTKSQGWFARMQPPLADQIDSEELWDMLVNGQIDIIETDYAPHSKGAKWEAEAKNPLGENGTGETTCYGVPGIEHVAPLLLRQVKLGTISLERLVEAFSTKPQEIIGKRLSKGTSVTWKMEDFMIDDDSIIESGAGWTPYLGMLGTGKLVSLQSNGTRITPFENNGKN